MLTDLILYSRKNTTMSHSGMDNLGQCIDKEHFKSYPYEVTYQFNSRGFRDAEWPIDLKHAVWCLGDSFTVGLGAPIEHTWPHLLSRKLDQRCVNVSLDGASNQWISRRAVQILSEIKPALAVLHWSFIHRVEDPDTSKSDEYRRVPFLAHHSQVDHCHNLIKCITDVESAKGDTKVIHTFIPNFMEDGEPQKTWDAIKSETWSPCPSSVVELTQLPNAVIHELKNMFNVYDSMHSRLLLADLINTLDHVPAFGVVDYARDGFHYDLQTASKFVDAISKLIVTPVVPL